MSAKVRLFSTCPQSADYSRETYLERLIQVARWSDEAGCEGILVYTDNRLVDNWFVAQLIIQNTKRLCPLVAVQPAYMHPYATAKKVASLAFLHSRRVHLNMVAGGFVNDLASLNDSTAHDRRYDRLLEYTRIIKDLLSTDQSVSFNGEFYSLNNARMNPHLPPTLSPDIFVSGSSEAGLTVARAVGAVAVKYPKPPNQEQPNEPNDAKTGVRVGIIARRSDDEAWKVAHDRFPQDRKGEITHELAMKTSDSVWHKQLSGSEKSGGPGEQQTYWLQPFQTYKTFCPYLVGSYQKVGREVESYVRLGYTDFILDIPADEEELNHTLRAFEAATGVGA
jgi:alkanesulfonate monooxygenase